MDGITSLTKCDKASSTVTDSLYAYSITLVLAPDASWTVFHSLGLSVNTYPVCACADHSWRWIPDTHYTSTAY